MLRFLALLLFLPFAALAQPALDGHNTGTATSGTTVTFTATTAANPEQLIAVAAVRATTTTNPNLSIAGCTLSWSVLGTSAKFNNAVPVGTGIAAWTAKAASNLAGCTVTITSDQTIQNATAGYCSFSGINNTNAFDPHSGLPATTLNSTSSNVTAQSSLSTTLAHDTLVTALGQTSANMGGIAAFPTGGSATLCANATNSGGLNFTNIFITYKTFTSAQSSFAIGVNASEPFFNLVGTALTADAPASTSKPFFMGVP